MIMKTTNCKYEFVDRKCLRLHMKKLHGWIISFAQEGSTSLQTEVVHVVII